MNVSPTGSGNITSPQFTTNPTAYPEYFTCSQNYQLTAVPAAGYTFVRWNVSGTTQTTNPINVSVNLGEQSVTAYFELAQVPNTPPTADAGNDQTVWEGNQVTLDGSGSFDPDPDDSIQSYLWTQTAGTPAVTLSNASTASPTFTAPEISGSAGTATYTFQLTVQDTSGETDTDTVTITVSDSGNDPPTADAGSDQTVTQGTQVQLDGSGSFDPDNNIESYNWVQTQGTTVTLSNASAAKPTFTAPTVTGNPITLIFKLTVKDSDGAESEDVVTITVRSVQSSGGGGGGGGCFITGIIP